MDFDPGSLILRHLGLIAMLVWSANGVRWWLRGTRHFPEKTDSYRRLLTGYLVFGNLPWLLLEAGVLTGAIAGVDDLMKGPPTRPFAVLFFGHLVALLLLGTYWIFARGGAETLVEHAGPFHSNLDSPTPVKILWLAFLAANFVGLSIWLFSS